MTVLDETIALALKDHDKKVTDDDSLTPEAQSFIIRQIHRAADELHFLAKTIREAMPLRKTKSWRVVSNIQDEMMAEAQCYSRFLWLANLRANITDKIEDTYGLSFSGLRIHRMVLDKADGRPAYVCYDPTVFPSTVPRSGESYTVSKDGAKVFVPVEDFEKLYNSNPNA